MAQQYSKEIQWLLKEKYHGVQTPDFFRDVERIKKGEPLDYIIGFVEFLGCKIDLSKHPFIPRPETEFWVEQAIANLRKRVLEIFSPYSSLRSSPRPNPKISGNSFSSRLRCLDLFSGSGCIGVAVLKHVPFAIVDFAEKEKKFVEQIKINAKLNAIDPKRYRVVQSDIFSNIKGKYDYIFANPPYIAENKKEKVQKSVLDYEPRGALFGRRDGLLYIKKFLKEAKNHLNPNGKIYMEFDSFQKPSIAKIVRSFNFRNAEFFKDQYKKWRFLELS